MVNQQFLDQDRIIEQDAFDYYKNLNKCIICGSDLVIYINKDLGCSTKAKNTIFDSHFYIGMNNFLFNIELNNVYIDFRSNTYNKTVRIFDHDKLIYYNDLDFFPKLKFDNIKECIVYFDKLKDNLLLLG